MSESVAVVGSRKGADMQQVLDFIEALHAAQPNTLLISGGAVGVDQMAESTWFRLGGRIRSYRPVSYGLGYGIEVWNYGGPSTAFVLPPAEQRIQLADYGGACVYRDTLIAEDCDRLVAFYRPGGSSGTQFTEGWAREYRGDQVYTFAAAREDAA